jgi:hydroxymethylpyrimidine pyrophosphatase-like HAD family hydrolase
MINSNEIIKTNIDRFLSLVYEKGTITTNEISLNLNIPKETIEKWAEILDEEGQINLEYSKLGGMICKSIDNIAIELKVGGKIKGTEEVKKRIEYHEEKRLGGRKRFKIEELVNNLKKRVGVRRTRSRRIKIKKPELRKITKKIKRRKLKTIKRIKKYKKHKIKKKGFINNVKIRIKRIFSLKIKRKKK